MTKIEVDLAQLSLDRGHPTTLLSLLSPHLANLIENALFLGEDKFESDALAHCSTAADACVAGGCGIGCGWTKAKISAAAAKATACAPTIAAMTPHR